MADPDDPIPAARARVLAAIVELDAARADLARMLEERGELAPARGRRRRLRSVEHRDTVGGKVDTLTNSHRLNISASRSPGGKKADPFLAHIRDPKNDRLRGKGFTLRSLADELPGDNDGHLSASMLSMNRRTHGIPKARAVLIQKLTGWPADLTHWPAGILS